MKQLLHRPAVVWWSAAILLPLFSGSLQTTVYFNDFNGPLGITYPEWTSSGYANAANLAGTISSSSGPQTVTNVDSPNRKQRFLGEFGGPKILTVPPYDANHFVRVDETVVLTLRNLEPHSHATVSFDLYILKSWDGNNPTYGPDRWSLKLGQGTTLLDTTFSNNFKTGTHDLSLQNYPALNSSPQTGATAVNSLGYRFYGDSIYHLTYTFPHGDTTLILCFSSSLFEGKGTEDESWGLDNVRVLIDGQRTRLLSILLKSSLSTIKPAHLCHLIFGSDWHDSGTPKWGRSGDRTPVPDGHAVNSPLLISDVTRVQSPHDSSADSLISHTLSHVRPGETMLHQQTAEIAVASHRAAEIE